MSAAEPSLTLQVENTNLHIEWQVRLQDLSQPLRLDSNHDGQVSWPEIEHRRSDIETYLESHLHLSANGTPLPIAFTQLAYGTRSGEPFLLAQLQGESNDEIRSVAVTDSLPGPQSEDHSLLTLMWSGGGVQRQEIATDRVYNYDRASAHNPLLESVHQGIWHIWTGYDHILFLIVLLIPAVFQRTREGREAVSTFRDALVRVVIIVSAFTVAHSITLACAVLGWIHLPSRLVESVIAASIVVAALNNLMPHSAGGRSAWLAFSFGLIHGFGFAGAAGELGADLGQPLWQTLLGFNLGVETGQLAIVCLFLPLAYLLRQTRFYRTGVLYGGSTLAGLCALVWFWQRAFGGSV
jgi:hypothetical protein